ncbi:protein kinase domain containing protein [Stylonychia lemnae]|uniref:Protein kinase domain containing protein n=1 Tax=Stylonychia lemnae TaxID=5949 RepID=A0A077ZQK1_STYLE|nr:protein kinase domain containing protein [Stylonychia lemnae]|eukprot:CDW72187.1 protein kinase domain containing protein [Stylonychia lemnae]
MEKNSSDQKIKLTKYCIKGFDYAERNTVNQYSLLDKIGEGSISKIFLALVNQTQKKYAIKRIPKNHLKNKQSKAYKETWNEIDILEKANHPNVIQIYEVIDPSDDKGEFYLILEYCEKGQLLDYNEETKLFEPKTDKKREFYSEDEIRQYSNQIASGLDYLHYEGIIHCDLKPLNILLDENNIAKIADFGVSQKPKDGDLMSNSKGTFEFLSPELVQMTPKSDKISGKAIDLWAFGLIIYCMTFNDLPFSIGPGVLNNIKKFQLDFTGKRRISYGLKALIQGLLQKDPSNRFTMQDVFNDPWFNNQHKDKDVDYSALNVTPQDQQQSQRLLPPINAKNGYSEQQQRNKVQSEVDNYLHVDILEDAQKQKHHSKENQPIASYTKSRKQRKQEEDDLDADLFS